MRCDVEDAIVKVGDREGPFSGLGRHAPSLERDARFPVRVTLQFYKSTSNGVVTAGVVAGIAAQLAAARAQADYIGSLVTAGRTWRPTEPVLPQPLPQPLTAGPHPNHPTVVCDNCQRPLSAAVRYKCLQCPNFDLCPSCEAAMDGPAGGGVHNPAHVFLKVRDSVAQARNLLVQNRAGYAHAGVSCHRCRVSPIVGFRFACMSCPGLSLCESCEAADSHQLSAGHNMVRVVDSAALLPAVPAAQPPRPNWGVSSIFSPSGGAGGAGGGLPPAP
jgi:hypothetical protein